MAVYLLDINGKCKWLNVDVENWLSEKPCALYCWATLPAPRPFFFFNCWTFTYHHNLFSYVFIDEHLKCFKFWVFMIMLFWTSVNKYYGDMSFSRYKLRSGHAHSFMYNLWEIVSLISKAPAVFYIPSMIYKCRGFSTVVSFLIIILVMLHLVLIWAFPNAQ